MPGQNITADFEPMGVHPVEVVRHCNHCGQSSRAAGGHCGVCGGVLGVERPPFSRCKRGAIAVVTIATTVFLQRVADVTLFPTPQPAAEHPSPPVPTPVDDFEVPGPTIDSLMVQGRRLQNETVHGNAPAHGWTSQAHAWEHLADEFARLANGGRSPGFADAGDSWYAAAQCDMAQGDRRAAQVNLARAIAAHRAAADRDPNPAVRANAATLVADGERQAGELERGN